MGRFMMLEVRMLPLATSSFALAHHKVAEFLDMMPIRTIFQRIWQKKPGVFGVLIRPPRLSADDFEDISTDFFSLSNLELLCQFSLAKFRYQVTKNYERR